MEIKVRQLTSCEVAADGGAISLGFEDVAGNPAAVSVSLNQEIEGAQQFASGQPAPAWLSIDREKLSGKVLSLPKREEINLPVNEQLIVELYSK